MTVHALARLIFAMGMVSVAWADEIPAAPKSSAKLVTSADVVQWLLALLLVLAVFLLLVWALKKSGGLAMAGKNKLAVLAGLSLGMREKLVLVRVGEKELLLGVSSGRIDKLLELEGEQRLFANPAEPQDLGPFAKKLLQAMQGKAHEQV
ncbi:flagellar biosynthetic protein FliO [Methylomonas koyamae]|uniref:Flagellar protein n=2 Tax=Methylomonas koyamae TaxID=702114 RepID=A0A177N167_9GAMM|nr:flagellar biosynthetic protein FliO [Methylomonas koyamae]